jgi:hypothetical protein
MEHKHITRVVIGALVLLVTLSGSAVADDLNPDETVTIEDSNDTVKVDVEFSDSFVSDTTGTGSSYALVEVYDKNGTQVQASNITVNESSLGENQTAVWKTATFTGFEQSSGNLTVKLSDSGSGINETVVSVEQAGGMFGAGGGILGGASETQVLLGVVVLVVGLVAFRRMDMD